MGVATSASKVIVRRIVVCSCVLKLCLQPRFAAGCRLRLQKRRKKGGPLRGGAWSRIHALEPGRQVLMRWIERLAYAFHEVEKGEQEDINHRKLVAGDERLGSHHALELGQPIAGRGLEVFRSGGNAANTILEDLQPQ